MTDIGQSGATATILIADSKAEYAALCEEFEADPKVVVLRRRMFNLLEFEAEQSGRSIEEVFNEALIKGMTELEEPKGQTVLEKLWRWMLWRWLTH